MSSNPVFRQAERQIGNHLYRITVLNAVEGRHALHRLARLAGPALAATGSLERAILASVANMAESDLDYFVDLFEPLTEVSGGSYRTKTRLTGVKLTHFVDNYFEFVEWLKFCVEENFNSFFEGAVKLLKEKAVETAKARAASNATSSDSAKTSTGGTGA